MSAKYILWVSGFCYINTSTNVAKPNISYKQNMVHKTAYKLKPEADGFCTVWQK